MIARSCATPGGSPTVPGNRGRRWCRRLPIVILTLAAMAFGWIWGVRDDPRQSQFLGSVVVTVVTASLLMLWVVFLSPFPRRIRWGSLVATVALLGGFLGVFRIEAVTGDLVPIFRPRWTGKPDELLPKLLTAPTAAGDAATTGGAIEVVSRRDWPRFLGPLTDGVVGDLQLERDWVSHPPKEVWRASIGAAWSSFAIVGSRAVTQEQRGEEELVVCYDVTSGELLWAHSDRVRYDTTVAGVGPRATPTIDHGKVYSLGATGVLNCLDGASGRSVWRVDLVESFGGEVPDWGFSCSPLVVGELVVVTAPPKTGRSLLAFDRSTGKRVWTGGDARASYSSPMFVRLVGVDQIVLLAHDAVVAHEPDGGELLWKHPWPGSHPKVTQPVIVGDRVLVSSGYGVGCELFDVLRTDGVFSTRSVWKSRTLKSKFANIIVRDGFAYGLDDGIMVSIDLATGKRRWKSARYGHGQLLLVGDTLLLTEESSGDVVLVEPTSEGHRELARIDALGRRTWNPPALAGDLLLVRNASEVVCYRLEPREP